MVSPAQNVSPPPAIVVGGREFQQRACEGERLAWLAAHLQHELAVRGTGGTDYVRAVAVHRLRRRKEDASVAARQLEEIVAGIGRVVRVAAEDIRCAGFQAGKHVHERAVRAADVRDLQGIIGIPAARIRVLVE